MSRVTIRLPRLSALLGRLPMLLLLAGMLIFVFGLFLQYVMNRPVATTLGPISAPFGPVALFGLMLAAVTLVVWFSVAGFMLARQTRLHGADYGRAYFLIEALQFTEAIPLLEQSMLRGKETPEVLTLLARAYAYTGRYSRAHMLLERASELYPQSALPYEALGFLFLLESNADQAIAAYSAAIDRQPSVENYAALGYALAFTSNDQEALTALERAATQPLPANDALRVYYHLMQIYTRQGNAAKAANAAIKMVTARDGLEDWIYQADILKGTGYGQRLNREIQEITDALNEADAAQYSR
jgi:tetratricopeptide (TPR) repeat protein